MCNSRDIAKFAWDTGSVEVVQLLRGGRVVKNVVLCFDQMRHHPDAGDGTNAAALFRLLDESEHQTGWYHTGTPRRARQRDALADARTTVRKAYAFVVRNFEPDDRILVFGTGRGGYCAQALTRLLGTVGILPPRWDDLVDFFVSAYGLPRTRRSSREWARITQSGRRAQRRRRVRDPRRLPGAVGCASTARVAGSSDAARIERAGRQACDGRRRRTARRSADERAQ